MAEFIIELDPSLYPESAWATLTEPMDEAVRCRDCRRWVSGERYARSFCSKHRHVADANGFCAWAERRDDEPA